MVSSRRKLNGILLGETSCASRRDSVLICSGLLLYRTQSRSKSVLRSASVM